MSTLAPIIGGWIGSRAGGAASDPAAAAETYSQIPATVSAIGKAGVGNIIGNILPDWLNPSNFVRIGVILLGLVLVWYGILLWVASNKEVQSVVSGAASKNPAVAIASEVAS